MPVRALLKLTPLQKLDSFFSMRIKGNYNPASNPNAMMIHPTEAVQHFLRNF